MQSIRIARIQAGLTQAQLGARTGLDQASVSRIERGYQAITVAQLLVLARALSVEPAALLRQYNPGGRVA